MGFVGGVLSNVVESNAFVNLQELNADAAGVPVQLVAPSRLAWNGDALTIDSLDISVGNGRLLASGVKQTSGHAELDRAAMDMLARANPLPAIPEFMNRDELALAIPVEYSLITDR